MKEGEQDRGQLLLAYSALQRSGHLHAIYLDITFKSLSQISFGSVPMLGVLPNEQKWAMKFNSKSRNLIYLGEDA